MRRLLVAAACLTGLSGCFQAFEDYRQLAMPSRPPGAEGVKVGPPAEVFPLVPGARFDYVAHFGLGTEGPFTGEAVVSVLDAWRLGDRQHEAVRVVSRYFGRERIEPYVFVRDEALIGLFEKAPPDTITWFMPTHLEAGAEWDVQTGEGAGSAEVEAVEPSLTVPAGSFKGVQRVRYRNAGAKTDITLWLAPHLGLVKARVEMIVSVLPLRGTLELSRFRVPKAD